MSEPVVVLYRKRMGFAEVVALEMPSMRKLPATLATDMREAFTPRLEAKRPVMSRKVLLPG